MSEVSKLFPEITLCKDAYETATGADVLTIVTEWNQFRALDLERLKGLMNEPVMVDLRNIYSPASLQAAGFHYVSVGR
jgi:UDPglucose 6-dehydrogenase